MNGLTPDRVAKAGISRTYQNIRLFRNISAIENLLVGMHLHLHSHWWGAVFNTRHTRTDEAAAHEAARQLLQFVGLRGRGDVVGAQSGLRRTAPAGNRPALWPPSPSCCCWTSRRQE